MFQGLRLDSVNTGAPFSHFLSWAGVGGGWLSSTESEPLISRSSQVTSDYIITDD
jgi:hypothetical protein